MTSMISGAAQIWNIHNQTIKQKISFSLHFYFNPMIKILGGCLKTSLAPLNGDPGVSLGQMIGEFLKREPHINSKNQTDFEKQTEHIYINYRCNTW